MGDRPRVFVARRIPDDGLQPVSQACEAEIWRDSLAGKEFVPFDPPELTPDQQSVWDALDGILTAARPIDRGPLAEPLTRREIEVLELLVEGLSNKTIAARLGIELPTVKNHVHSILTKLKASRRGQAAAVTAEPGVGKTRLPEAYDYVRQDRWKTWGPMLLLGHDVHGSTLGIVGFGRIGQALARRASGFGMQILYHDVNRLPPEVEEPLSATFVPLDELLARSDFVSLHVNLTPDTEHLMNAERLRQMKPTGVLVNTSRGPVVDHDALFEALRDGVIFAAGLDVTEPEPLPPSHPLLTLDSCLVVPHIASASRATRGKMAEMAAANLLAGVRGERLPTPVNPEVYERG